MSELDETVGERTDAHERIEWLERELEREREQARQTSKLVFFATYYAESIRQRVRRDAELTLRKARERAAKIVGDIENERRRAESELRQTQAELGHAESDLRRARVELFRLQALTDETRKRLSAFTTAALEVLEAEVETSAGSETGHDAAPQPVHGDLRDALQTRLSPSSDSAPATLPSAGTLDPHRAQENRNGSSISDEGGGGP